MPPLQSQCSFFQFGWSRIALPRLASVLLAILLFLTSAVGFPSASLADNLVDNLVDNLAGAIAATPVPEAVPMPTDSADIPADKVDQFAGAYLKVLQLLSDREPELPAAETSAEALKVQQSIESEAIALIEDSGL